MHRGLAATVALMLVLLISGSVWNVSTRALGAGLAVLAIIGGWAWLQASEESDSDGQVWDAIPGWQYDGRHVESGGITRGEQEDAIESVQEKAASMEAAGEQAEQKDG